jgi:hypothetical protein
MCLPIACKKISSTTCRSGWDFWARNAARENLSHTSCGWAFMTGNSIRVVQPAEIVGHVPWELEGNKSSGVRFSYDVQPGKGVGTLTVRDEVGFVETHFLY